MLAVLALVRARRSVLALVGLGASLAAAFFVRYESLAIIGASAVALLVLFVRWPLPLRRRALRREWEALEGRLLAVLAPPLYAVLFWMLVNWLIMGDPLYFQRSLFSLISAPDVARNVGPDHPLWEAWGSLPITAAYALKRTAQVNVAFPLLAALSLGIAVRQRDRQLLALVVVTGSVFAFTAFQVFQGSLPGYLRYWASATPFAVVLAGGCAAALGRSPERWRGLARAWPCAVALFLLLGVAVNVTQLADPSAGLDEQRLAANLRRDPQQDAALRRADFYWIRTQDAATLAAYLDELSAAGLTLVDTETSFAALLRARHPERLMITSDRDFPTALRDPRGKVRYIVIADPRVAEDRDLLNQRFPTLYDGGLPWARFRGEVAGVIQQRRVYEIDPPGVEPAFPAVDDLRAANPNIEEQMATWKAERRMRNQTPVGWLAFRRHVQAIGGPDPGDLGPAAFYQDR
jgi:hypothetical protein